MKNLKTAATMLLLSLSFSLTGCSDMADGIKGMEEMVNTMIEEADSNTQQDRLHEDKDKHDKRTSNDELADSIMKKYGISRSAQIAPFYNIDADAQFVFHFRADVNPAWAVTVHTDSKCGMNSMVYQINDGYDKEDGTDVVVNPGRPVLGAGKQDNGNSWGYAPIYYLCIRYDLESTDAVKLENPIVVPFTIKSGVSIPNVSASVNNAGQYEISWNAVDNADRYNIYRANPVRKGSGADGYTRAECGYVGDYPELIATVGSDTTSFLDFGKDNNGNLLVSADGYVSNENFFDLGTYYVTAVDKNGGESLYSIASEGWKFGGQLPKSFESSTAFDKKNGYATTLPDMADVRMYDGSISRYPISYERLSESDGYATYEYSIDGTLLTGTVNYKNETGIYEQFVKSGRQVNMVMHDIDNNIDIIPVNTVKCSQGSKSAQIFDGNAEGNKIAFPDDAYIARADIESARIITDGIYPDGSNPLSVFVRSETDEKVEISEADAGGKQTDTKPQKNSDEYMVFADSAEEEYLAVNMINAKQTISMKPMPKLQNTEYMLDVLYKVVYQNPYIIGVESFSYNFNRAELTISYSEDAESIKRQQEEILAKSNDIIASTIKEGMDDEQKMMAIWNYLEKNTTYDNDACMAAEASGFMDTTGYEDSFSTYGIICRNKGVCQSYMHATKLLCSMAGLRCESLTGYLQNSIPHGWNIVMMDGNWYWVDTTNSMTNSGVPYFIYETSYEFAADSWDYVLDDSYELDTMLDYAKTNDMSHDYHVKHGLFAKSHAEITDIIEKKINDYDGILYIKCTFTPDIDDMEFVKGICAALHNAGYSDSEIANTSFGNIGQVMVIDVHGKISNVNY